MTRKSLCFTLLAFFILFIGPAITIAQPNPQEKPRKVKQEPKKAFIIWLEDVGPIITEDERKAFLLLTTDEEREKFIDIFWGRRDPDPDTEVNEYKEEYYERIAYANEHFSSGIPGWKTDRGRIYIAWGKPDEIESNPMGGQTDNPYYAGSSSPTYSYEKWFYRYLPGVGSGVEIEFVDPTGSGEYRLARSPDEKRIPGFGGSASNNTGDNFGANRYRRESSPFDFLQTYIGINSPPPLNNPQSPVTGSDAVIDNDPLEFDVRVDFYRQSNERIATAFTIQTDNKYLSFPDVSGVHTAKANISGTIFNVAGKRVSVFQDVITTIATVADLATAKERKSVYQKAVALPPGIYKIKALVRDTNTGAAGVRQLAFTVPKYEEGKLSTSSIVLASRLQTNDNQSQSNMFVIGPHKVIPNVSGVYRRGQEVGVYMQIYNAGIDQTTLRPAIDVEYVLQKGGKEIFKQTEDWRGLSDSGQRLVLARLLSTASLQEGEYELLIKIRDQVTNQALTPSSKFVIEK